MCSVATSSGEPAVMVLPMLLATIFVLDLAATKRNSDHDAKLSRVVLTGWLTPVVLLGIGVIVGIALSLARAVLGWQAGEEVVIAEMGPARPWVEHLTPGVMMLWVAAVAVAAWFAARCPRDHVTWVQMSATLFGALLLPMW